MYNDIRLFIRDKEVEFSKDPGILFNYTETELHNPTVVRNSFTKQIVIEGTPRNNDIFSNIWNLEMVQDGGFNPIRKTDFTLFIRGELFQKGYCKLDKITRTNNTLEYSLTLYGSLGSFFYNLTYVQDESSSTKKTLASLDYSTDDGPEPEIGFTINKDAVKEAWDVLTETGTGDDKWKIINFIPALNGIPEDFSADRALVNLNGIGDSFSGRTTVDGTTYRAVIRGVENQSGYTMAEASEELQEWQTRDLRSYNQRPCISMKRIIDACCRSENNGGYKVELDPHFFNDSNPYYKDAWVTLGMLKDLNGVQGGQTYEVTGATINPEASQYGSNMYPVTFTTPSVSSINNVDMTVSVRFQPDTTQQSENLYPHFTYAVLNPAKREDFVKDVEENQGVIVQMFAIGEGGEVVGQSKAYLLAMKETFHRNSNDPMWKRFWKGGNDYGVEPEFEFIKGYFKKIGGSYVFVGPDGIQKDIRFSFTAPSDFVALVMKVERPHGEYVRYLDLTIQETSDNDNSSPVMYTETDYTTTGYHSLDEARRQYAVSGHFEYSVTQMSAFATDYESFLSGAKISKERLLSTEKTPADYLLSYCKLFGLYFYFDSTEEATDKETYPSGVVHIMDRNTFFTDDVVNMNDLIDWNKKIEIVPAMADAKWYKFDVEQVDGELNRGYMEQFGREYGSQLVNTNYNYDANTKNLYDGNAFKTGIMALEKDKYYKKTAQGLPVYQYNGLKYQLYHRASPTDELGSTEIDFPRTTTQFMSPINPNYDNYDAFPKLQLHGEKNEAVDGEGVLVFLDGSIRADSDYWITDDVTDMKLLNDDSPCWILTRNERNILGERIARKVDYFPFFTRDIMRNAGGEKVRGNISRSWNFGHPQIIYIPDTYSTDGDSIYDSCWRDYMRDMYHVDGRKLVCYVKAEMDGRPWPWWLRRFYWFENSLWRLNKITDLNINSLDTCKMEFIKIQDLENYKLGTIS